MESADSGGGSVSLSVSVQKEINSSNTTATATISRKRKFHFSSIGISKMSSQIVYAHKSEPNELIIDDDEYDTVSQSLSLNSTLISDSSSISLGTIANETSIIERTDVKMNKIEPVVATASSHKHDNSSCIPNPKKEKIDDDDGNGDSQVPVLTKTPENGDPDIIMAGPTNPLKKEKSIYVRPIKFSEEKLILQCGWDGCDFQSHIVHIFTDHVVSHVPMIEVSKLQDSESLHVSLVCCWKNCPFRNSLSENLQRHLYIHAYHTRLKSLGQNVMDRDNLPECKDSSSNSNIVPDLSGSTLVCSWGDCREEFLDIQGYYDHIRYHCESMPKKVNTDPLAPKEFGEYECEWTGCNLTFKSLAKLRDHTRSHTQEKVVACPKCGTMFASRTRLVDHCNRQLSSEKYCCDVCFKGFPTARLLRDHIRSHVNSYPCPQCDMSCANPSALNSHLKYRHSNVANYPCPHCSYAAKSKSDICRHIRIHDETNYKCEECDYKSKTATSVTAHFLKVHAPGGPPRYLCHICDKKYFRGNYLTKHLKRSHEFHWPSGHRRFRYKLADDGFFKLVTLRFESEYVHSDESQSSSILGLN